MHTRKSSAVSKPYQGKGLGLHIAQLRIDAMGSSIAYVLRKVPLKGKELNSTISQECTISIAQHS